MKYFDNVPTGERWSIPCSTYYLGVWSGMFNCKLGTVVTYSDAKTHGHVGSSTQIKEATVILVNTSGVNVVDLETKKQFFIKWPNVIGFYV